MKLDLLHNRINVLPILDPQIQTNADTAFVSDVIDTANFDCLEILISYGALTDTNVTFTVLVEDGDASNLSDNAPVDDAYLLGTEAGATPLFSNDGTVAKIGYIGPKRYVRVTITPSGNNSGDINISAVGILTGARKEPFTTQLQ
jgi:hypothetical protein